MDLSYSTYCIELCPLERLRLPRFIGATLRGVFGYAFKGVACKKPDKLCSDCPIKRSCIYKRIFDIDVKRTDAKFISGFESPPRPFVIRPALIQKILFNRNEPIRFELVLIGWAQGFLSSFVDAFQRVCENGISTKKIRCELKGVARLRQQSIGESFTLNSVKIKFLSPFRFKRAGKFSVDLDFPKFSAQLLKRISLLGHFYQDGAIPKRELEALLEMAKNIKTVESKLKWCEFERYSTRQKSRQKFGGVIGHIIFEGDLTPFSAYLKAGEDLHVGKQTTFGLGQYKLDI